MEKPSLDNTDLKILTLLAKNGRVSYRTIAHAIDLTTKSVKSRVDRMLEARVIEKFIAFINPSVAGYHKTYSFALRKGMLNPELFERINLVGEIQYRFEVMGGVVGFAIAIREEDEDKMKLLSDALKPAVIAKRIQKHNSPAPYELTRSDYLIIKRLLRNPRMEITEIAEATSISPKTVRRRLDRMLRNRIVDFSIMVNPDAMKGQVVFFLEIKSGMRDYRRLLERVYVELGERPIFFSDFSSPQDAIGLLVGGRDTSEIESIRTQIESLDGVQKANVFLPTKVAYFQEGMIKAIDRRLARHAAASESKLRSSKETYKTIANEHDLTI